MTQVLPKTYLVTGGAGFIGANLLLDLHERYPGAYFVNVDKLTYAANAGFLAPLKASPRYKLERVDICQRQALHKVFVQYQPDTIIHLAAESHVDNSIENPADFIDTNVVGTFNLLEEARGLWSGSSQGKKFHHVSTDEVYGALKEGVSGFNEAMPYAPNSPYAASKASSDMLVRAYFHTYGLPVVTTNCSNNFGPNQHAEKLIPKIIKNALAGLPIPVYGDGRNVRDWLFVKAHCRAIDLVCHQGRIGETYLIGTRNEVRNIELVKKILGLIRQRFPKTLNDEKLIRFVTDRLGHDYRYAIDPAKLEGELGWRSEQNFDEDLTTTVNWYLDHPDFFTASQGKVS